MKTLSLPIRGQISRLSAAGGALFALTQHAEGASLGLYRVALSALKRGELRGEAGLTSLLPSEGGRPLVWADTHQEQVWAIDDEGRLFHASPDANSLTLCAMLREESEAPPSRVALALSVPGAEAPSVLWSDSTGSAHLWREGEGEVWSWSNQAPQQDEGDEGDEGDEAVTATAMVAHGATLLIGLSDGRVMLWLMSEGRPQGEPVEINAHSAAITSLAVVEAEGRPYLISACEALEFYQTRLDDLSPMPRASKGKGLHTIAPHHIIPGPLGRFYTVSADGAVKAWSDAYSNLRPASHDELGELSAAVFVACPKRNLEGEWPLQPSLALATRDTITVYELVSDVAEGDEASVGRLGSALAAYSGVEAWLDIQCSDEDHEARLKLVERISAWGDELSVTSLARLASRDADAQVRRAAVEALLKGEHPSVNRQLEGLLDSEDKKVAAGAFKGLRRAFGEENLQPMRLALKRGQEHVCSLAVDALAERALLRDEAATAELKALFTHRLEATAQAAVRALEGVVGVWSALSLAINTSGSPLQVKVGAVQRLYRVGLASEARAQGLLQALRERDELELREAALSATLLARPALASLLRSRDVLLHEQLRAFEALDLTGKEREVALKAEAPSAPSATEVSVSDRQALFELSACAQADNAIYGPVALAELGDLRALPILLALSREERPRVRARATRGLVALASKGEHRAAAQLQRLCDDQVSEVRLAAYQGLEHLLADDVIHYVDVGLSAARHDVRLAAISAAQRIGLPKEALSEGQLRVLRRALCHAGDLELAREARKVYLRDEVGGDALGTHLMLLESTHEEIRRASLHDLVSALSSGAGLVSGEALEAVGGGAVTDLSGQSFVFTGTLSRMKRADAQKKVKALGGSCPSGVSAELSFLVIGDEGKAGSKLDKAKKLGVRVLSESEFLAMVGEGGGATPVVAPVVAQPAQSTQPTQPTEGDDPQAWVRTLSAALIDDPSADLRAEARRALIGAEEGKGALTGELRLDALEVALSSAHLDNRLEGVKAISDAPNTTRALALLTTLLDDQRAEVSTAALREALKLSDEAGEQLLSAGLSHQEEGVRSASLSSVIAAPKRAPWREGLLWRALEDASPSLRAEAMSALKGDEAVAVAERLLTSPHPDLRMRAAMTLAREGDARALPVALEVIQTPMPTLEEVERAQEALSGPFGLLDERRWRREVTVAIAAHQSALAHAEAAATACVEGEGGAVGAYAGASASVRQSISSLVQVRERVEGAHASAVRVWREALEGALAVLVEGEFDEAWEVVWSLRDHQDEGARRASWATWRALTPHPQNEGSGSDTLNTQLRAALKAELRDNERATDAAWALTSLGDEAGLYHLTDSGARASSQVRAAHVLGDQAWRARLGARVAVEGGAAARLALMLEVTSLITSGGEPSVITAALSSDQLETRRLAARLIERAHSADELLVTLDEVAQEGRDVDELALEGEFQAFEEGGLKKKPKGKRPVWLSSDDWRSLAALCEHSNPQARARGVDLLAKLPRTSDAVKALQDELKRLKKRYAVKVGDLASQALSADDARSLAFGAYTGMLSLSQDVQALKELTRLIDVDPVGALALFSVVLRGSASLRNAAREALHEHREALGLSEVGLAELLLSTNVSACVKEGAEMIATRDGARALELIKSDDADAALTAYEVSFAMKESDALLLSSAAISSESARLRPQAVQRIVRLFKAAQQLGWLEGAKAPSKKSDRALEPHSISEDDGRRFSLSALDLMALKAFQRATQGDQQVGDVLKAHLTSTLSPAQGERPAFMDVQLLIAESFAELKDPLAFEPLHRALQSLEGEVVHRATRALTSLGDERCAPAIFERMMSDAEGTLERDAYLNALAELRDASVLPQLLALFDDERFRDEHDELSEVVMRISGFDEPIDEDAVWEEMSKQERKAEQERGYQSATLAQLITASARKGRYWELYYEDIIDNAKTARAPALELDASLAQLFKLPHGSYQVDNVRRKAVEVYGWRASHRGADLSPLTALISHRDDETRWGAAEALALAGSSEGLTPLLQLVKERDHAPYGWRQRAVKALGVCGDLRAVRALLNVYDDPEDYFSQEALEALGHMSRSEVAGEVRSRLIAALTQPSLVEVAVKGIGHMNHEETWAALRLAVRRDQLSTHHQRLALEVLQGDSAEETLELFMWLLTRAKDVTRHRADAVKLAAYEGWRARLGALPELTDEVDPHTLTAPSSLEPERLLFSLELTRQNAWDQAARALALFGDAPLWLDLCLAAGELSDAHQRAAARFEAALRALDPAPLSLLLERLPEATKRSPQLADMTLELIGAKAEGLSAEERTQLLTVTSEVREAWLEAHAETLGAPVSASSSLGRRLQGAERAWARLLWLWGQAQGGVAELWAALELEALPVALTREALSALSRCVKRGEAAFEARLLSLASTSQPELASMMSELTASDVTLTTAALEGLSSDETPLSAPITRSALWSALTSERASHAQESVKSARSSSIKRAILGGDLLAIDALVRSEEAHQDASLTLELLEEARADALAEPLTCALLEGAAQLARLDVEQALVELAKSSQREAVVKAAWRARRRSSRARARVSN